MNPSRCGMRRQNAACCSSKSPVQLVWVGATPGGSQDLGEDGMEVMRERGGGANERGVFRGRNFVRLHRDIDGMFVENPIAFQTQNESVHETSRLDPGLTCHLPNPHLSSETVRLWLIV